MKKKPKERWLHPVCSASLTPETDALAGEWIGCECVPASHAQKLEIERDQARREAEVERLSGSAVVAICRRQEAEIKRLTEACNRWSEAEILGTIPFTHSQNVSDQIPRTQDVANTTDSPERLSASDLFAPCDGCVNVETCKTIGCIAKELEETR